MTMKRLSLFVFLAILLFACQKDSKEEKVEQVGLLRSVPAIRLSYRFEADVPAPSAEVGKRRERTFSVKTGQTDAFFPAVLEDFERNRQQEILEETFVSPDGNRVLALYRRPEDVEKQYRLDVYSSEGKLLKKVTPEGLAVVYFPDSISWSPDSKNFAFIGTLRLVKPQEEVLEKRVVPTPEETPNNLSSSIPLEGQGATPLEGQTATPAENPTTSPTEPTPVFRTEQIYICDADGNNLKPITQNEGLIYFYFVWSPNSEAVAALALTWREWELERLEAERKGEVHIPSGRLRVIEKNGRMRLLDDRRTKVLPVWSPDSTKIAIAFGTEVCIYDAFGDTPTQASIPLKNQLLIASQKYEEQLKAQTSSASNQEETKNSNATGLNQNVGVTTLPKEEELVSFNPIVDLFWAEDRMIYFQTAYMREMKDSSQSVRSFTRYHRIILSAQG